MQRKVLGRSYRFATRIVSNQHTSFHVSRFPLDKKRCRYQNLNNHRYSLQEYWFHHLHWKSYRREWKFEELSVELRLLWVARFFSHFPHEKKSWFFYIKTIIGFLDKIQRNIAWLFLSYENMQGEEIPIWKINLILALEINSYSPNNIETEEIWQPILSEKTEMDYSIWLFKNKKDFAKKILSYPSISKFSF